MDDWKEERKEGRRAVNDAEKDAVTTRGRDRHNDVKTVVAIYGAADTLSSSSSFRQFRREPG